MLSGSVVPTVERVWCSSVDACLPRLHASVARTAVLKKISSSTATSLGKGKKQCSSNTIVIPYAVSFGDALLKPSGNEPSLPLSYPTTLPRERCSYFGFIVLHCQVAHEVDDARSIVRDGTTTRCLHRVIRQRVASQEGSVPLKGQYTLAHNGKPMSEEATAVERFQNTPCIPNSLTEITIKY